MQEKPWYALEQQVAFEEMHSNEGGLTEQEAGRRLKQYGLNTLEVKSSASVLQILVRQLHNPIVYVLIVSTLLAVLLGKWTDSLVVFAVVILNTLIGFIQEYRAHQTIRSLTEMVPHQTTVIRDGSPSLILSSHVVPGDVVVLQAGDRISADLRLFSLKNLQCDESALTGESLPVSKRTEPSEEDALLAERKSMAYNGTYITSGAGLGLVVATGLKTEFGKISELIEHVTVLETPMSLAIKKIAQMITLGVAGVSAGLFGIALMRGSGAYDACFFAITLAIAAIPEGLPSIITIASSVGVRRMARRQAIIRQLPAVEALGSTSIICTDKTGTLTYNEMMVQQLWTPSGSCLVTGAGYSLEGEFHLEPSCQEEEIVKLLTAAILCSDATLDESADGEIPLGDPTEIALVVAGRKKGIHEDRVRKDSERVDVIPFEPEKRIMATLNQSVDGTRRILIKGAPEEVLAVCIDTTDRLHQQVQEMAKLGMRVLAVASKQHPSTDSQIGESALKHGYALLGLIGMIDPPRKEAYRALKTCHEAGINVKMVTGDHPLTAQAIGKDLGILGHGQVLTGRELTALPPHAWKDAVLKTQIFARVAPEHKLKLVETLQELGHVVAMTGDGVNDAAALKRADIGVAMGLKGTAVAKQASDMILADDNFASIEAAVEEGRRVYDNLIKSLAFVLPTSLGQALVIFLAVLFFPIHNGVLQHPMSPVQILWVNLVVAVGLALPLAFESAEQDIMKRPPRPKQTPLLQGFLLVKTLTVSCVMALGTIGLFLWEYQREISKGTIASTAFSEAQTTAVTAMMLFQIVYLFYCRSLNPSVMKTRFFENKALFWGVGIVLSAQVAFIYLPQMNRLFKTSGLDGESWVIAILVASTIVPIMGIEKFLRKRLS